MQHVSEQGTVRELFALVGGSAYGPPADEGTHEVGEQHWQLAAEVRARRHGARGVWHPEARRFYYASPKPRLRWYDDLDDDNASSHYDHDRMEPAAKHARRHPAVLHVAVHVRRGDVSSNTPAEADGTSRFLPMPLVASCIARTLKVLRHEQSQLESQHGPATPMRVHIFSQGAAEDFDELRAVHTHTHLHLDEPLPDTFHHLVMADAIVMAASTLSDVAAWLAVGRGARVFAHPRSAGLLKYMHQDLNVTRCA